MNFLIALQLGSIIMTIAMALILVVSRLHMQRVVAYYETSRWLLFTGVLLLCTHYLLQMVFGFRAKSDNIGALVNILFYAPSSWLIAYSLINISSPERYRKRYLIIGITSYVLILIFFIGGLVTYHSLDMPHALWAMEVVYALIILYTVINPWKEVRRVRKTIERNSGSDMSIFNFFQRSGMTIFYILTLVTPGLIFSRVLLALIGPIIMVTIFLYVTSFACLGFNLRYIASAIREDEEQSEDSLTENTEAEEQNEILPHQLPAEEMEAIDKMMENWRKESGYRDPTVTIASLSRRLDLKQTTLSHYIQQKSGATFRVWLSNMRIEEAKRLLLKYPNYSNETIAEECGFTSRNYFQNLFKSETGHTPREWRMTEGGKNEK